MVLLVEGPDTHPHWARCVIPRGIALACVAMGAAFSSLRPGPVLRAMFFVDFVTMLGSESAVHVYLSTLSPRSKRVLLLLILLIDTSTLVAMLAELPEGWAAAIGRVRLFWSVSASLTPVSPSPSPSPGTPLLPRLRLLRRLLGLVDPGRGGGDGAAGGRRVERRVG